jgi:NhaP-type Na+/H+ and K+/H+ antiporter
VLEQIATMTVKIKHYDRLIQQLTETEYPETQALIKVYGVGQLTALTYVLTLGSKERFERSRDVGRCYLGLRLAVGLVLFPVVGLAWPAGSLLPGFDWKAAILLGAVVAATDAIAATSIARRVELPQRIADILEAERLVNDGTGLLALQFGLLILVTGHTSSVVEGVGRLVFLTGGGVLVGLAIGAVVTWFEKWVDDGPD